VSANVANLIEQFPAGNADELLSVNFPQDHPASTTLELRKYGIEKIGHGSLASARQIKNSSPKIEDYAGIKHYVADDISRSRVELWPKETQQFSADHPRDSRQ